MDYLWTRPTRSTIDRAVTCSVVTFVRAAGAVAVQQQTTSAIHVLKVPLSA